MKIESDAPYSGSNGFHPSFAGVSLNIVYRWWCSGWAEWCIDCHLCVCVFYCFIVSLAPSILVLIQWRIAFEMGGADASWRSFCKHSLSSFVRLVGWWGWLAHIAIESTHDLMGESGRDEGIDWGWGRLMGDDDDDDDVAFCHHHQPSRGWLGYETKYILSLLFSLLLCSSPTGKLDHIGNAGHDLIIKSGSPLHVNMAPPLSTSSSSWSSNLRFEHVSAFVTREERDHNDPIGNF